MSVIIYFFAIILSIIIITIFNYSYNFFFGKKHKKSHVKSAKHEKLINDILIQTQHEKLCNENYLDEIEKIKMENELINFFELKNDN